MSIQSLAAQHEERQAADVLATWRERIREAAERIRPVIRETPVEQSAMSPETRLFLKLEHLQHTGSFKFRGASNKILSLSADQAAAGVITASNGNHGLAVAAAARSRGVPAEVYVSETVSSSKLQGIRENGTIVCLRGSNPLDAELAAREAASRSGKVFISPYNDADVIAGQGTIALELQHQLPNVDAVFVAAGGGGLIGGIGAYLKAVFPNVEIIGCWPENSPVLYECWKAGKIIDVPETATLSESTAGGLEPCSITLDLCRRVVDRGVLVTEREILRAMRLILATDHWLVEGAAGVALAAYLREAGRYQDKTAVVIVCGRNVSAEVLGRLL